MLLLAPCSNRCPQTPEASFSDSNPISEPRNGNGPIRRLRLRFLNFFKCALLPNINHVVERDFLFMGAEQLEDIFSILRTNLRTSLDVLGLAANDANAVRSNSRRCISGGDCMWQKRVPDEP